MTVREFWKKAARRGGSFLMAAGLMASAFVGVSTRQDASACLSASASTFVPYSTYTFDYEGNALQSPHAYVASENMVAKDMGLLTEFSNPSDMLVDSEGYLYVADTGNSRIVFFDENMQYLGEITEFYNEFAIIPYIQGKMDEEAEALEENLERRLKTYAKDEENPGTYDLTAEELQEIEKRIAAKADDEARATEYEAVVAEFAKEARPMPDFERLQDLLEYALPVTYAFDCIQPEEMVEVEFGKTEEERRYAAYYGMYLMATTDDPGAAKFTEPEGLFVDENGTLYVADTGNYRIIKLEHTNKEDWSISGFTVTASFTCPESSILSEDFVFAPQNLVVDSSGRLYVNVKNVNSGIMQLNAEGEFMGYFGAQKVSSSVMDWFLQLFQSDEQRARTVRTVPRVYNNIAIDSKNFVWVTANSMDNYDQVTHLSDGDSSTAPIKRLNPSGSDVLVRNGLWAPAGDVVNQGVDSSTVSDVSSIMDVAIKGDTGIYTLVDDKRQKLFTYDSDGDLLYAFGGTGSALGVFTQIAAVVYQGSDLLVLDKTTGYVTRFQQTAYATAIEEALTADDNRDYEQSEEKWKEVQKLNANFDLAYIGLAKSYVHRAAQAEEEEAKELYQTAMEYYKLARNTEDYSTAYKQYRSLYVRDHLLLVLAVPVALLVLIYLGIRAMKKVNAREHITGSATTLGEELCFGWRVIFHPAAGFWELKREKRGTLRAAFIFLALAVVAYCYQATGTAYMFRSESVENVSLLQEAANVILPVVLWVVASWAFTTLMSGEGSMKDIFIATCYSLIPMILMLLLATLLSNVCSLDEQAFLTFFKGLGYGWMVILIIMGSMVVQDYTFGKNLLTVILSIFGMAAILFIVLLLISLTGKLFGFFETIYQEIVYRL